MKTFVTKKENIQRKWYLIDASDLILGKVAVKTADFLRGKTKATFSPAQDLGDFVIIINSDRVKVTGGKEEKKEYFRHSGYPGGIKSKTLKEMMEQDSRRVIENAVKGMLPKNKLASVIIKKLKVYKDGNHPHEAQKPEKVEII